MGLERTLRENTTMLQRILQFLDNKEDDAAAPPLEEPVTSIQQLLELDENLANKDFAKKLVCYPSSLGGGDEGDTVRRIMRKIATNLVWSHYSVLGQKGKKKLAGLRIFQIIKRAFKRNYGNASDKDVEMHIGHTLKHAPHRPGGINIRGFQARPQPIIKKMKMEPTEPAKDGHLNWIRTLVAIAI